MMITVNGKTETLEKSCTLSNFLLLKGIEPKTVVIELNGNIPEKTEWDSISIADGDVIEILKFMGGG